jgi:hypothetical protein
MRVLRTGLFGVLMVAALGISIDIQETRPAIGVRAAVAQTESKTLTSRVGRWTRARLQAAKKHWAEHERWFSECSRELESLKKSAKRVSYDRQAHFLEDCMRRKH